MTGLTAEMADDLVAGAAELAHIMVYWPEDELAAALVEVQGNLRAAFSEQLGAEVAEVIARAFARTVARHRVELQVAGYRDYQGSLQ